MKNSELRLAIMQKRIERNLTQTALANILQVSQKSVSMWENGETVPREPMRIKMAQVFGLPIDYFLDIDENSAKDDVQDDVQDNKKTTEAANKKIAETTGTHNEVERLAEALLNKYNDQHIDMLITKLKEYR